METEEATNPGAEDEHVSTAETGVADEAHAQGDDFSHDETGEHADTSDGDGEGDDDADTHEEIEHDGEKYKVPKKLKEAFLRQADYTRKTQEIAEQRRAIDTDRTAWEQQRTQQAEILKEMRSEIGAVERLSGEIKAFEGFDWRAAQAEIQAMSRDPNRQIEAQNAIAQYNLAWNQFTALERDLNQAKAALADKEQALSKQQTERVQAVMRETVANLQRDIPGFGPDLANKIVDHGMKAFGLRPEEAQQMADPRIWKLLNSDYAKSSEIEKLKAENAKLRGHRTAQANNEAAQQVKPATQVKGRAPNTGLSDNLPHDEWLRRRNAQVAKQRA